MDTERLSRKDFTDVNGWSGRYSILSRIADQSPKQVSGLPLLLELSDGKLLVNVAGKHVEERLYYSDAGLPQRVRSEEHTSELQSPCNLVCRLLLEKKKKIATDRL